MRAPSATVLLSLFLVGCGNLPAEASASPASTRAPRVEPIGDAAVFRPRERTEYVFMLPGAAVVADGMTHAWVVGFGTQRGDQEVLHLASAGDGSDWEVVGRRVEDEMGLALDPPGPIPSAVLPPVDGDAWVMYFAASPDGGADGTDIWRATAPGPGGPWSADPEPVLSRAEVPTESGSEPVQVDFPAVVRTDRGYLMLFGWSPSGATTLIRSATSVDGIDWTVADAPSIDLGLCGGFDTRSVAMPRIAPDAGGGWLALYGGFGEDAEESMALGLARSDDGTAWTCASADPILEVSDIPGSERIHSYAVLASDGEAPRLMVESLVDNASELWLAALSID